MYVVEFKVLGAHISWGKGVSWKWHSCRNLRISCSGNNCLCKGQRRLQESSHNRGIGRSSIIQSKAIYSTHLHLLIFYCTCFEREYNCPVTDHSEQAIYSDFSTVATILKYLSVSQHEFKFIILCSMQHKSSEGKE